MPVKLYIADANARFDRKQLDRVRAAFVAAKQSCSSTLGLIGIDVVVVNAPMLTIPEVGVGGFTPSADIVYIYLDAQRQSPQVEIEATLCHEIHHAARHLGPGAGRSLLEAMVFEGLATSFEREVLDASSFFVKWLEGVANAQELVQSAKPSFEETGFDHQRWFIDDPTGELPRWYGYTVGYHLVQQYIQSHRAKASELALEPASTFAPQKAQPSRFVN